MKSCNIILDGVDRTGKDSTRRFIIKQTKGQVFVIVRGELSQIIYSRIYGRKIDEQYFKNQIIENSKRNYHYFLLDANYSTIKKRCLITNERDLTVSDISYHRKQFKKLINELKSKVKIHIIDTSYDNPAKISRLILDKIKVK